MSNSQINDDDHLIIKAFNLEVYRADLNRLINREKLNDIILNFYLKLICNSSTSHKCAAIDSLVVNKILGQNLRGLSKCLEKFSKQNFTKLFCPIFRDSCHLALADFDVARKTIKFYDSIYEPDFDTIKNLGINLGKYIPALSGAELWNVVTNEKYPKQHGNGIVCGVYVCAYSKLIAFEQPLNFSQDQMSQLRQTIANEILKFEIENNFSTDC